MERRFLTKKSKITIREDKQPAGLAKAMDARSKSGEFNSDALKNFDKKLSDYYKFDNEDDFKSPKYNRSEYEDAYEIEDLGAGKMLGLKYDNEDTEVFKSFSERMDKLNDTSEYDKEFGTHDGFGETDEEDETYETLKDNSKKYIKHKYGKPEEYHLTPKVRVTNESKTKKMKRLNFKNEFESEYDMKVLIPESYKTDGNVFLMTDGNQTYKVRWDDSINEGTVISHKNKSMINEDMDKMKKLFNYSYEDSMGKTNNYGEETNNFKRLYESSKNMDKLLITEEEKSRVLGNNQSVTERQYLKEVYKTPDGITYKLDFKDSDTFSKFVGVPSNPSTENPYAKKLGFYAGGGDNNGMVLFVVNIWHSLAFIGRSPLQFSWGNSKMIQSLFSEASVGLKSLKGFIESQQFVTDEKLKIWNQPVDSKNPKYTIWNWFYDTYIKPDIQTRAALTTTPKIPSKS